MDRNERFEEEYIEQHYDEMLGIEVDEEGGFYDIGTDEYYNKEDLMQMCRNSIRRETLRGVTDKIRNPFGIREKLNDFDKNINSGPSRRMIFLILGCIAVIAVFFVVFVLVLNL